MILAAGKGTRLKSKRPKVLHEIGGKPLIAHVIRIASSLVPSADIHVVVGHEAAQVGEAVENTGVQFVLQSEQRGTGHALQCARKAIAGYEQVLVLSGDAPLITVQTLTRLLEFHREMNAAMTLLTASADDPTGYGRVVRESDAFQSSHVRGIVEQKDLAPGQETIREINSGIYVFQVAALLSHLDKLKAENSQKELYLTDLAGLLAADQEQVMAIEAPDPQEVMGANTIAELVGLDATLREQKASKLMAQGVTILRPETCLIDAEVEVGADTVIEPGVQLLGRTRIGSDCLIRSGTVIENSTVSDGVLIRQHCVITDSAVMTGAKLGPFAHLRPGSQIGAEAHIGNFVETKNAKIGQGAKVGHLTYLGDAEVGAETNIGAGVITCNYDGVHKHQTRIGAGAFVGSDSTLVAPISIGDGAYVGAGSCITKDVPEDALAVGRGRQVVKEGWAAARKVKMKQES